MPEGKKTGLADLTAELFEPFIGQAITFERPAANGEAPLEPARMQLLEVKRGHNSPALRREPFSLFLVMKDQPPLGPGLHRLAHSTCESADLLVTRVTAPKYEAADPTGMFYEVIFG
ncbi:MAG TPA: hypothetical protein VMJ75_29280 [Candidatus Acidoferrales bacterium]|nr:hypothetical protein [Candidatus Acidoferrales bacterium]